MPKLLYVWFAIVAIYATFQVIDIILELISIRKLEKEWGRR